ncbi:MAG: hypothetical protein AAFR13_05180 [Pseudomonadota bacterium]
MATPKPTKRSTLGSPSPEFVIGGVILVVATFGFAGWSMAGTDVFVSLVEAGLAWCL